MSLLRVVTALMFCHLAAICFLQVGADDCVDVDPNCGTYTKNFCVTSIYKGWAEKKCKKTCNLCEGRATHAPGTCYDEDPICDTYVKNFCTTDQYKKWAEQKCRKTCKLC